MAKWHRQLKFKSEFERAVLGEVPLPWLAEVIAVQLRDLKPFSTEDPAFAEIERQRLELVDQFMAWSRRRHRPERLNADWVSLRRLLIDLNAWASQKLKRPTASKSFDRILICFIDAPIITPPPAQKELIPYAGKEKRSHWGPARKIDEDHF